MNATPRRPRVGITCDLQARQANRGDVLSESTLGLAYVEAVRRAGGLPVLVAPCGEELVEDWLAELDGLVISGGALDVPPDLYGEEPHPRLGPLVRERTAFEAALLRGALGRELPILGVCYGMQLLHVILGGSLFQDLSCRPGTALHEQAASRRLPSHTVRISPGSLLATIGGASTLAVNSTHHQVVREVPVSTRVSAVAEDGVIEGIEKQDAGFVLGVQWHPEMLDGPAGAPIYEALVSHARAYANGRREMRAI